MTTVQIIEHVGAALASLAEIIVDTMKSGSQLEREAAQQVLEDLSAEVDGYKALLAKLKSDGAPIDD